MCTLMFSALSVCVLHPCDLLQIFMSKFLLLLFLTGLSIAGFRSNGFSHFIWNCREILQTGNGIKKYSKVKKKFFQPEVPWGFFFLPRFVAWLGGLTSFVFTLFSLQSWVLCVVVFHIESWAIIVENMIYYNKPHCPACYDLLIKYSSTS